MGERHIEVVLRHLPIVKPPQPLRPAA